MNEHLTASPGNNQLQEAREVMHVKQIKVHIRHDDITGENNLALLELSANIDCSSYELPICIPEKDFAERVLLSEPRAILSSWNMAGNILTGKLAELQISHLHANECKQTFNRSLTTREFCGYSHEAVNEQLAGGSFSAVDYKGTWFLTGILETQATEMGNRTAWETFTFSKISRYMMWFTQIMG